MLDFIQFKEEVVCNIKMQLGDHIWVSTKEIVKNNGVTYTGILICRKDQNMAPTIYLETFYEQYKAGRGIGEICNQMIEIYERHQVREIIDVHFFRDYEKVKNNIVYKLIHKEKNQKLLMEVPYLPFLDLAIVFYYLCEEEMIGGGTILIRNEHIKEWGVSTDELFRCAENNTRKLLPIQIIDMNDMFKEMLHVKDEEISFCDDGMIMYILTNSKKIYGAISILYEGILREIWEKLEMNYYILPSSIHEVIVVPKMEQNTAQGLLAMVKEVNRTHVDEEEILSDSIYYYDGISGNLSCICTHNVH